MKTTTAKELRNRTSAILENVIKGDEVVITIRGKSISVLKPINKTERKFNPVGFGIWKGRRDMKDAAKWVSERRKERFQK